MFKENVTSACICSVYFSSKANGDRRYRLLFFSLLLEQSCVGYYTDYNAGKKEAKQLVKVSYNSLAKE